MGLITFFILPNDTQSELGEDGWVFETKKYVSESATQKVIDFFNVPLKEVFLGIKKYQNEFTQINVILNDTDKVNEILIRTKLGKETVFGDLSRILSGENIEIFDPKGRKMRSESIKL